MTVQFTLIGEGNSQYISVFVPGHLPLPAGSDHPNFAAILDKALNNDPSVIDLFDVATSAATKFERITDQISTAHGQLYWDGEVVDDALTKQIVRYMNEGVNDWRSLVKFFENVMQNPNEHSREQLYRWLDAKDFTITSDGLILGYKGVKIVNGEYVSIHSGKAIVDGETKTGNIPNYIGAVVEMPRSEVTHDPAVGCHYGLHVGTYDYASRFAAGALLEVHVNPRDVVSVPTDSGDAKMRTCRYTVVNTIDAPVTSAYIDYGYNDCDGDCYDDECDCGNWGEPDYDDDPYF